MARPGKVWWHAHKRAWYSTIGGKKVRMADGDKTRDQAEEAWHQYHAKEIASDLQDLNPVGVIFELYLDWIEKEHPGSYRNHRRVLQSFLNFHRLNPLRVRDMTVTEVLRWLNYQKAWSDGSRWMGITVVKAALNWAAAPERRVIGHNPIAGMKRPSIRSRGAEAVIDPEVHRRIYEAANEGMRQMLLALRQTGTRCINICRVEAQHCDFERDCIVLPEHKTAKKTGKPLTIPMTAPLKGLLQVLCKKHRTGKLFRTRFGGPWTPKEFRRRYGQVCDKLGIKDKPSPGYYRHTVATELLLAGMPISMVAELMGHTGTKMIEMHYGHLNKHIKTLVGKMDGIVNGPGGETGLPPQGVPAAPAAEAPGAPAS